MACLWKHFATILTTLLFLIIPDYACANQRGSQLDQVRRGCYNRVDRNRTNHGGARTSSALARYEMAADLVSLYDVPAGNTVRPSKHGPIRSPRFFTPA